MKIDFLIVGQGLAGSLLAWRLLDRGKRVLVVDRDETVTSSKVAAGLVTPLAGSRFNLPDGFEERLDFARSFYWNLEETYAATLFHHRRIARLFSRPQEREAWASRLEKEGERYARFHAPLAIDESKISAPYGGFEMREGGWLDVPAFLELTRQVLLERASYAIGRVRSAEVVIEGNGIQWKNVTATKVVFCEGWRGNRNHFFEWVPMNPAAGDILELTLPDLAGEGRIISKGSWLIPVGGGRFRAGSTYHHRDHEAETNPAGAEEVLAKVRGITTVPATVLQHRSAIRPIIRRSQIFMGLHPAHPQIAFFNGLGSKGVVNGPSHADRLADHLVSGTPLPEEADLRRNLL